MKSILEKLVRWLKLATASYSEAFCRRWADFESKEPIFDIRHEVTWEKPWRVEFYDLHKWAGERCHWNCHDVGFGEGMTLKEAWKDLEAAVLRYSRAKSRECALVTAELEAHRDLHRGWGNDMYAAYYSHIR